MLDSRHFHNRIRNPWTLLIWLIALGLLLSGCGAAKPKVYRVGIMYGIDTHTIIANGFKAKMTELGYVEGQNVVYEVQMSNSDPAKDQQIAEKFVADKVDLIFAFPTKTALVAKTVTQGTDIPVVFAFSTIEGTGLVDSLRKPGSNITGVRYPLPELTAQRFEFLYKMVPELKRLWIFYDVNYPTSKIALESLRPAAAAQGVTLVEVTGALAEEIPGDLEARSASSDIGLEAMLIMPEPNPQSPVGWSAINSFAARHKVPVAGQTASQVEEGALFSYAPDLFELGKLVASPVDKIFKGTPAGSIPVITPESYLTLNYKVAQELGLTVPEGLLNQAAKIIR